MVDSVIRNGELALTGAVIRALDHLETFYIMNMMTGKARFVRAIKELVVVLRMQTQPVETLCQD
jgi:hypothetical protein